MIAKVILAVSAAALCTATAVVAQAPSRSGGKADPNRQICRTLKDTGSRLGGYRACHTAAEWAELRRQTQQTIDRIQNNRPASGQ